MDERELLTKEKIAKDFLHIFRSQRIASTIFGIVCLGGLGAFAAFFALVESELWLWLVLGIPSAIMLLAFSFELYWIHREERRSKRYAFRVVEDTIARVAYDEYLKIGPFYRKGILRRRRFGQGTIASLMLEDRDPTIADIFYFEHYGRVPVPDLLAHILSVGDECYLVFYPEDSEGVAYVYSKRSYRAAEGLVEKEGRKKEEIL